ncbi:unnamed protein product [Macrosiphum euphorbiae]|uniref:Uncharacterized protein n=1 Tax=Macrosiphum euphorbiae TaxID=13131 RepID=A0AAV0WH01_9HEMI|nr:unnamed protein product [Macrosiphum euphorbiae]
MYITYLPVQSLRHILSNSTTGRVSATRNRWIVLIITIKHHHYQHLCEFYCISGWVLLSCTRLHQLVIETSLDGALQLPEIGIGAIIDCVSPPAPAVVCERPPGSSSPFTVGCHSLQPSSTSSSSS